MSIRTNLKLTMLLHYSTIDEPFTLRHLEHANSIAFNEQREELISQRLLLYTPTQYAGYTVTPRGKALIERFLIHPLPIETWTFPNEA